MLLRVREWLFDRFLLPGSFLKETGRKRGGSTLDAGYAIVLAFGRRDCPEESFLARSIGRWGDAHFPMIRDVAEWNGEYGTVDTFEMFEEYGFDPGLPNKMLADLCFQRFEKTDTPLVLQWEIAYTLWSRHGDWYRERWNRLIVIWPEEERYLSTRHFFLIAKGMARLQGWYNPLIIAHPEHVQRAYFVARRVYSDNEKEIVRAMALSSPRKWFDKWSVQWWTRGPMRWLAYEMLVRIHHWHKGWL